MGSLGIGSRGRSRGFVRIEPITKELPLEYAFELNRLIELEMVGSIG